MSAIVFDSGPIISLTMNNLLWILRPLKKQYGGDFLLPAAVKAELVDNALRTKKFMFEALQVAAYIEDGTLTVVGDADHREETLRLLAAANSLFSVRGKSLTIVHYAEASALAAAKNVRADALVIDERVTRELVEHPAHLSRVIRKRMHGPVHLDRERLRDLRKHIGALRIFRSAEMVTRAFELGLLDRYVSGLELHFPHVRRTLLESILWGVKTDGCAIRRSDIRRILSMEKLG